MTSGVYGIINTTNGKQYVGSSVNIEARWHVHRRRLHQGNHHSRHLQNAWDSCGEDSFAFVILETTEASKPALMEAEQRWIDATGAALREKGYNCLPTAFSHLGAKRTDESRMRLSIANRGEHGSQAKISEADVIEIRKRCADGESYASIAADFPISTSGISGIYYRNSWKHIGGAERFARDNTGSNNHRTSLNESQVAEIKQRLCDGEEHAIIAADYGVNRDVISGIAKGHSWKHVPWPGKYDKKIQLRESDVIEIKRRIQSGEECTTIAKSIGACVSCVSHIATGRNWSHVSWPELPLFLLVQDESPEVVRDGETWKDA